MTSIQVEFKGGKMVAGKEKFPLPDGKYEFLVFPEKDEWASAYELISEYSNAGEQMLVGDLLTLQDKLTVLCVNLSRKTGSGYKGYVKSYGARKIAQSRKVREMIESGASVSKAEKEVNEHISGAIDREAELDGEAKTMELMLNSFYKVLGAIQQRVSHEKQEYRNMKMNG